MSYLTEFEITETQDQQLIYRFSSLLGPAMALSGTSVSLLVLFVGGSGVWLALLGLMLSGWCTTVAFDRSEFRFDPATQRITGWRKRFRQEERFDIPFSDLYEVLTEVQRGLHVRYRPTLLTATGFVPLAHTFRRGRSVMDESLKVHAWLQRHGVEVPLHQVSESRIKA